MNGWTDYLGEPQKVFNTVMLALFLLLVYAAFFHATIRRRANALKRRRAKLIRERRGPPIVWSSDFRRAERERHKQVK